MYLLYMHSPADTDNKVHLRLCRDVEVAGSTRRPLQADLLLLRVKVLLHIGLCALEDDPTLSPRSLVSWVFVSDMSFRSPSTE